MPKETHQNKNFACTNYMLIEFVPPERKFPTICYLLSQVTNNTRCNIQVYNAIIVHRYLGCVTPTHHREEREVLQQTCAISDTDECFGAGHRLKGDGTIKVLS